MSTTSYDTFLPEVMQYVPNVPDFIAVSAIRNACIEFCTKTRYLQVDLDPMPVIAGVPNYEIDTPTGTVFVDIVEAWLNKSLLTPAATEELTQLFKFTDWRTQQGEPRYITRIVPTELFLVPVPSQTIQNGLLLRVSLAPSRASTSVDTDIYERFLEHISYGARARLYGTPGQPYYDKASALEFERRFRSAISDVRISVNKGLTRSSIAIEFKRVV